MGNWQLDPYHTEVGFSAKHLGMMTVRGHFTEVAATADIDPAHPESSSVQVTISVATIPTNHEARITTCAPRISSRSTSTRR